MKRLRVDDTLKEGSGTPAAPSVLYGQSLPNVASALAHSGVSSVKVVSEGMQSGLYPPAAVNYSAMPAVTTPHSGKSSALQPLSVGGGHSQMRATGSSPPSAPIQDMQPLQQQSPAQQQQSPSSNFQRLKVEDALTYLDQVKFKFGSKPQVYNDFLDIMKEFKSQSIDTPGVIQRVSNLFKGFPELISGFNTFLPPGYKIEVQRSDQGGYAFQVSVSMPSPTGNMPSDPQQQKMILRGSGIVNVAGGSMPLPNIPQCQPISLAQHIPPVAPQAAPSLPAVVHHSSSYGSGAPTYNNSLSLSAAQVAVSQALQGHTDTPQNQPVQFNHAINYVNKIKNRFHDQPEKYKRFLDILHIYQKEQRSLKEASVVPINKNQLTEQEVYRQVATLFENQSDLLAEFGQFLPDATSHITPAPLSDHSVVKKTPTKQPFNRESLMDRHISHKPSHMSSQLKRSPTYPSIMHRDREAPPAKKHKITTSCRDVTLAEAGKFGSLNDYAFFDKVRHALRTQDVYNNFLRCLNLFNQEIISKSELLVVITPFLTKFPDLLKFFRDFVGQTEVEPIPCNVTRQERPQGETALEIDLTTAKRLGASYCVIPPAQEGLKCSGRTQLCKEVLNDQWVSFPTWSEDSTFVSSRKTQYEEYMYRCEDERFELDVVIETNASTIRVLEGVQKKLSRMSSDDLARYHLEDSLGGSSMTLHQRAVRRIYGDKAQDIIDGLKRSPAVAVPVVLRRLKTKEDEWREAQKTFNKVWREQNEKYYLKSLDHQGINFKQTDIKALRSKSLFNEIETLFDERHDQNEEGSEALVGPHIILPYRDRTILDDAANLLIHHVKRQTGIQKGEKRRIKYLLRQFVPELFFHPKQQLTDDEMEEDEDKDEGDESPNSSPKSGSHKGKDDMSPGKSPGRSEGDAEVKTEPDAKEEEPQTPLHAQTSDPDEAYTLFMASNNWYIFLRLHAILCERLAKIYERAVIIAAEEVKNGCGRKESTAIALRLKPKPQIEFEDYYPAFLDMVKNLLDGNMDSNTYEDTLREMFGIHAYIAFTLDKVVSYAVRQLQHCVSERTAIACSDLYAKEQKRGATGGPCITAYKRVHLELAYQRAGEKAVQEENCFKIYVYKKYCRMTIELLDTDSEDPKKVDEAKKWSSYKECYADCRNKSRKPRSPIYLNRNLRMYKRLHHRESPEKDGTTNSQNESSGDDQEEKHSQSSDNEENGPEKEARRSDENIGIGILEALERKLNERAPPERNQTEHPGYDVLDESQCKFNSQGSKIMFTVNKESILYKISAFSKARKNHPEITKRLGLKFRSWLKRWVGANVSDSQYKQCIDWMMGRGEGVVPNRTRVIMDNDLSRTPYASYNRYRVERLSEDST